MQDVKIGIQTRSFRQPLRQAIRTAAQLGADGIEIDARNELRPAELTHTGLRQFRKVLDDLNLRVSAVAYPTRRGYDVAEDLDRRVLGTQAAMKFARDLGAAVVINRVGNVPAESNDERFGQMVEVLTVLSSYGTRVGAQFAAQTGSESGEQLARLMSELPEATIGVDLHPSALIEHGHSPQEAVAALGRYILHVHACDAVRSGATGGLPASVGHAVEVELGRGTADLPTLLAQLTGYDYAGWITIERHNAADPVAEIANAVAFLRAL